MQIETIGIHRQPFHTTGCPVVFVPYQSQQDADKFLERVLNDDRGIGVLFGTRYSGKTTIVNNLVRRLPSTTAVAVIDGKGIGANELLAMMLSQIGHKGAIELADSRQNLLAEVSELLIRQDKLTLLVLENVSDLYPGGLFILRELAALTIGRKFALKFILVDERDCSDIVGSPKMKPIGARLIDSFELGPLTAKEAIKYLHAKLSASGVAQPHRVLPTATCVDLHKESAGRPGLLDRLVLNAIKRADRLPIQREDIFPSAVQGRSIDDATSSIIGSDDNADQPRLLLTQNGILLQEIKVQQSKILFGRARLNDVVLDNQYVSKYHALLIPNNDSIYIVDLKSSNGIYVNSRRVLTTVLRHDDVIDIGNYRIKVYSPLSRSRPQYAQPDLADTSLMKTVADMRKAVTRKIIRSVSVNWSKSK